jgi:hypothetical protein
MMSGLLFFTKLSIKENCMKQRLEKVKTHVKAHKVIYTSIGVGIVVAGFTYLITRDIDSRHISRGIPVTASRGIPVTGESVGINNVSQSLIGSNTVLNSVSYFAANRQGPPSWVVRCLENDMVCTSQHAIALAMDLPESEISRHLNGSIDNVRGFHFERICMAA